MMQRQEKVDTRWEGRRRSVSAILARRQAAMEERRQTFPPDFMHGDVAVADIYDVLGANWVERALFTVDDGEVVTVAYFDDYFLVVEQWSEESGEGLDDWWEKRRSCRDRIIALQVEEQGRLKEEDAVQIDVDRQRLQELEQGLLGVVRDGMVGSASNDERRCRGQVDVLSLVTMMNHLLQD